MTEIYPLSPEAEGILHVLHDSHDDSPVETAANVLRVVAWYCESKADHDKYIAIANELDPQP